MELNKSVSYTTIDSKTVVVNSKTNEQMMLEDTASEIWKAIICMPSVHAVISNLQRKYPGYKEQVKNDVIEFVNLLIERKIINV
ncbi:MAG: PqqD family protein [Firmicutes bacterium]|nr:PqqD family protein [Bacillota bacterium]